MFILVQGGVALTQTDLLSYIMDLFSVETGLLSFEAFTLVQERSTLNQEQFTLTQMPLIFELLSFWAYDSYSKSEGGT